MTAASTRETDVPLYGVDVHRDMNGRVFTRGNPIDLEIHTTLYGPMARQQRGMRESQVKIAVFAKPPSQTKVPSVNLFQMA